MDLETENKIATMLLREAAELRRRAEKEGVRVYLEKPTVRNRPNSQFLTATVRGVQQANRAVEVDEMWRIRQKEMELDDRHNGRSKQENRSSSNHRGFGSSSRSTSKWHDANGYDRDASCSSSAKVSASSYSGEDQGLKVEDIEEFLHSRVKRGRGTVGSRMDETVPYLPSSSEPNKRMSTEYLREDRVILGPERPSSLNSYESSEEELDRDRRKKSKKVHSKSSEKHSNKQKRKERSKDRKKKRSRH